MPTLVRLFVVLVVLGILGFAGMVSLTIFVDPGEKDITIKIPARELVAASASAPLDLNNLPAPVNVAPRDPSATASDAASAGDVSLPPIDTSDSQASDAGVKTVDSVGTE